MKRIILALLLLLPPPCFALTAETAFSPDRGATRLVVETISNARHSVRMAAYSFTSTSIAKALVEAKQPRHRCAGGCGQIE